ncbi:MAG: AAA family ATPase [Candidatus Heimdallarchaeota archaeon]|nr:AAA family ATPase [Candidatus Heimdallarchaeota archaeon]
MNERRGSILAEIISELDKVKEEKGRPVYVDFQVLAVRDRTTEGDNYRLNLKLLNPRTKQHVVNAIIYPNEWYPGRPDKTSFSHYHNVLRYCFAGLASEGQEPKILLQILKAVWLGNEKQQEPVEENRSCDSGRLIILKFIISPDHNITGTELETAFNCPAKFFYEAFLGLHRSIRENPRSIAFVRGNAIHRGMQYASNEWIRSNDPVEALEAYHRAVIDEWRNNFSVLLRQSYYRGPSKDLKLPLQVDSLVVDQLSEKFSDISEEQLLNECLLFSPERGISGRADQIIFKKDDIELWEVKTGSRYFIETDSDPLTGVSHPGGIQAFAYRDVINLILGKAPKTFIEFFDADAGLDKNNPEIIRLEEHAVIIRRKIALEKKSSDEYLDLLLQTRNLAFAIESGLLSGYDRYKINAFLSRRYMPALGTDFDYLGSNWHRICNYCPSSEKGICADGKRILDADLWLHFPQELYEYWSWYFRQLKVELNTVKRHLHKLATEEIDKLTAQGITLAPLKKKRFDQRKYLLILESKERIFTRIREQDLVLVTPADHKPGEIFSVEGKIVSVGTKEVVVKTRSILRSEEKSAQFFRIDLVERVFFSRWQTRSLTDFLFEAMNRSPILGRKISVKELPRTIQLLFGIVKPQKIESVNRQALLTELDEYKVEAIEKALGLQPGELLLVQGPPGTGKTRMIAQLAREIFLDHYLMHSAFVDEGAYYLPKPVLVLTNTHRAADEVISKLSAFQDLKPFIIRLESYSKDHPEEVQEYVIPQQVKFEEHLSTKADPEVLVSLLQEGIAIYRQAGIIVGTLGSIGHNLLKGLHFSWVIVDEAGQATEPATLGAFRLLCPEEESQEGYPRVVLVGDHKQLPPVVSEEMVSNTPKIPKSLLKAGLRRGDSLKTSLFERLARLWENHTENVIILSEQYRMNEKISRIVKEAFYPRVNYRPANKHIGEHSLKEFLGAFQIPKTRESQQMELIQKILQSKFPVVFINTENDSLATEGIEEIDIQTESRFNIREGEIIAFIISKFLIPYFKKDQKAIAKQIGVISPYRRQNNLIYSELYATSLDKEIIDEIRVDTVDRFQGDEREIIILSLTNSNKDKIIGPLHRDWRRMNVSISRAKAKLIIIGNQKTFVKPGADTEENEAKEVFQKVFDTIEELRKEGGALELPSELYFPQELKKPEGAD